MTTKNYDLIVVGSGAGMNVASKAFYNGFHVALVDQGPLGGTCLNSGCIPSKILISPADVIRTITEADRVGIHANVENIDFHFIMGRMRNLVDHEREDMENALKAEEGFSWYKVKGEFAGDHTIQVGDELITAPKILIASGARALIPPIKGLQDVGYLDHVSVFKIDKLPESLIILGGGYIAAEFCHFFSAMGTEVTIIGRNPKFLKSEEPEISDMAVQHVSKYAVVYTGMEALRAKRDGELKVVYAKDAKTGEEHRFSAHEILVATGRRPNSDLLKPEMSGIKTDRRGWIEVNEYLETSKPGIWAIGDAIGKHMFRHTANYEASVVYENMFGEEKVKVDFHAVPHAVFTYPQIAGVGMTEQEAKSLGYDLAVGVAAYRDTAKGYAMDEDGLAKAIVDASTGRILGFHVIGSSAPEIVQQITFLMNVESQDYMPLVRSQIIHPSLSEIVIRAFSNLAHVHDDNQET